MNWMIKDDIFVWEEQSEKESFGEEKKTKFYLLKFFDGEEPDTLPREPIFL